jgi:hypothetical protein
MRFVGAKETYLNPNAIPVTQGRFAVTPDVDNQVLEAEVGEIIRSRPRKSHLPKSIARYGQYRCRFVIDFGSFRDLQRHRGGLCRMPLLSSSPGFNAWYMDQLPDDVRSRAEAFLSQQLAELDSLGDESLSRADRQYYLPIGISSAPKTLLNDQRRSSNFQRTQFTDVADHSRNSDS